MTSHFKAFLPALGTALLGLTLFGSAARADDAAPASTRLDWLQSQVDGLKSKLHIAQNYYGRPPGNVGAGEDAYGSAPAEDAAGLEVRITHLENQLRQINGQIEQMQFAEHKLEDQMKKFQQDVDFRLQDIGHGAAHPQKRTDASESEIGMPSSSPVTAATDVSPAASASLRSSHRNDAFDPSADPNAPGAPRQLGSIASSATALPAPDAPRGTANNPSAIIVEDDSDPNAPLDLSSGRRAPAGSSTPVNAAPGFGTAAAPRQIPLTPQPAATTPGTAQMAAVPPMASPKDEFDAALGYYKQKEYENAEKSFSAFLQKNPKNRMIPEAIYYLGETYYQRNRPREAAEQYLKISTDYSTSARAPEAMLHLGQSLKLLGAKEQACATFSEVTRKYPNAASWVKNGAEKGAQDAKC